MPFGDTVPGRLIELVGARYVPTARRPGSCRSTRTSATEEFVVGEDVAGRRVVSMKIRISAGCRRCPQGECERERSETKSGAHVECCLLGRCPCLASIGCSFTRPLVVGRGAGETPTPVQRRDPTGHFVTQPQHCGRFHNAAARCGVCWHPFRVHGHETRPTLRRDRRFVPSPMAPTATPPTHGRSTP